MPEQPEGKLRPSPQPPEEQFAESVEAYAELEVTTNFSFLRGASHPDELALRATRLGYRAIAATDHNSLAGVVRMHDAIEQLSKSGGWAPKLLVGSRLTFADGSPDVLVWATDRSAYGRLCRLLTLGRRRAPKGECHLMLSDLVEHAEGLLAAVTPGNRSPETLRSTGRIEGGVASMSALAVLREAMGDRVSLATSCVYGEDDAGRLRRLSEIARQFDLPLLATNDVHYHDPSRRPLQDVLTCVRHGCAIQEAGFKLFPNAERYLKSPGQMRRLFAAYLQAIRRGLEIAERCDFRLDELRYEYPDEIAPAGKTISQHLADLSWRGARKRYGGSVPAKVAELIEKELRIIGEQKWEAYFLTVYDLVKWARQQGILCQGRGSAANSAVCYCLGVTSVDPNFFDVLFERFVSAARNEPPDIDIDFEHERREEVIQYLYNKYGRERAGMTATLITYRGRSAVRDVGKALGLGLDTVDQMAKRLDWWDRGTLSEQKLREVGLDPADRTVRQVIGLSGELLGFPRHLSQHVGGMVMTRGPLCEMVPIENASMAERTVIEWDKDDIDSLGILKVDVLALGMLTCIAKAFAFMADGPGGKKFDLASVPREDPLTYDMICEADTIGVFQIESRAQMTMLPRLRPRKYYDLVIEVAIVRPGPIQGDMVHPYLRRRNGEEPVVYPKPELKAVLGKTLGVPLFQEQAMRIAMVGAGFSGEQADRLRRAMTGWRKSGDLEKFRGQLVGGMIDNGYTPEFAEQCWLQIRGFGEYGFPESHSASFALLVYVSAWIKRHHPAAFCAALLNSQPMGFYAPAQIVRDAREHGVEVRPADVNEAEWDCTLEYDGEGEIQNLKSKIQNGPLPRARDKSTWGLGGPAVRLGFRIIKGFRQEHAEAIVRARKRVGSFTSVEHFRRTTALPRGALRQLAEADAFTSLGFSRRQALWKALAFHDDAMPLFAAAEQQEADVYAPEPRLPIMPIAQEVMTDYNTTSLSLKRHPVALIRKELSAMGVITTAELNKLEQGKWVRVAGVVLIRQRPGTASGIVFETIEDETGVANLIIRPHLYDANRAAARHAVLLRCDGLVERQGSVIHVMAKKLVDLSEMLEGYAVGARDFH